MLPSDSVFMVVNVQLRIFLLASSFTVCVSNLSYPSGYLVRGHFLKTVNIYYPKMIVNVTISWPSYLHSCLCVGGGKCKSGIFVCQVDCIINEQIANCYFFLAQDTSILLFFWLFSQLYAVVFINWGRATAALSCGPCCESFSSNILRVVFHWLLGCSHYYFSNNQCSFSINEFVKMTRLMGFSMELKM